MVEEIERSLGGRRNPDRHPFAFGEPDVVIADEVYEQSSAYWVKYQKLGVGFRVVVPKTNNGGGLVQSISVFYVK